MKLNDQVASPPLAEELKNVGIQKESAYCWTRYKGLFQLSERNPGLIHEFDYVLTTYTVAELGEMMPYGVTVTKMKNGVDWVCAGDFAELNLELHQFAELIERLKEAKTEADARAIVVIYLKIKGKIV